MEPNQSMHTTMIVKTNTPLLSCLHCKENAPYIQLMPFKGQMFILISCPCNLTEKTVTLKQFLRDIGSDQLNNEQQHKCNAHDKTSCKYCGNCKQWLCNKCCKSHLIGYSEHIVTEYEIDLNCELHYTMNTSYCQQCNVKMCESCVPGHKEHTVKPYKFKKPIPLEDLKNRMNKFEEELNDYYKMFNNFAESYVLEIKKKRQLTYSTQKAINEDLILLYQCIWNQGFISNLNPYAQMIFKLNPSSQPWNKSYEYIPQFKEGNNKKYSETNYILKQKRIKNWLTEIPHKESIKNLIQLDETMFAFSTEKVIQIWNIETNQITRTTSEHDKVKKLVKKKNNEFASISDKLIKFWNTETYQCTTTITHCDRDFKGFTVLNDGRLAYGWDFDKKNGDAEWNRFTIWNSTNGLSIEFTTNNRNDVNDFLLLSNERLVTFAFKTLQIWNIQINVCCATLKEPYWSHINCLVELKDGRLASGSYDQTIKLWNTTTGQLLTIIEQVDLVYCLVQLKDGRLAFGGREQTIKLMDLKTNHCNATFTGHKTNISHLFVLNNGNLISAGEEDESLKVWKI